MFQWGNHTGAVYETLEALGEYFTKNVKNPEEMMPFTEDLVAPTVVRPADIDKAIALKIVYFTQWKDEYTDYTKRRNLIQQNMKAVFAIIWWQCSESLKDKIKSLSE
jgi:hypothetical protein